MALLANLPQMNNTQMDDQTAEATIVIRPKLLEQIKAATSAAPQRPSHTPQTDLMIATETVPNKTAEVQTHPAPSNATSPNPSPTPAPAHPHNSSHL
jgi:cell envelope opacity-associated protein A